MFSPREQLNSSPMYEEPNQLSRGRNGPVKSPRFPSDDTASTFTPGQKTEPDCMDGKHNSTHTHTHTHTNWHIPISNTHTHQDPEVPTWLVPIAESASRCCSIAAAQRTSDDNSTRVTDEGAQLRLGNPATRVWIGPIRTHTLVSRVLGRELSLPQLLERQSYASRCSSEDDYNT